MIGLFAVTIITCSDAIKIINRLSIVIGLSYQQKIEIIQTLREYIPNCPIIIKEDGKHGSK